MQVTVPGLLQSAGFAVLLAASVLAVADVIAAEAVSGHLPAWTWLAAAGAAALALLASSPWAAASLGLGRGAKTALRASLAGVVAGAAVVALQVRATGLDAGGILLALASGLAAAACAVAVAAWSREAAP